MQSETSTARRVLHVVASEGKKENGRIVKARAQVIALCCMVAVLLGIDYNAALILFTYLDPTLDGTSVGPAFLALTVPVAVVAVHLLIKDKGGAEIEDRLQKLAGIGVFIFLLGMPMPLRASAQAGPALFKGLSGTIIWALDQPRHHLCSLALGPSCRACHR